VIEKAEVYIKGRFLAQQLTGVQRYSHEILTAIDSLIDSKTVCLPYKLVVLVPPGVKETPAWAHIEVRVIGTHSNLLWEQWDLPRAVGKNLLISLGGMPSVLRKKQIAVLHDAAVFDVSGGYTRSFTYLYRLTYRIAALRKSALATVSKFSRGRLSLALHVPGETISIVYPGADQMEHVREDLGIFSRVPELQRGKYVLSVGSLSPNKNFKEIVEAARQTESAGMQYAVVGERKGNVYATNAAESIPSNMIWLGYVSDRELKALYMEASCFVFPSLYEGFGSPPLEAMSCGCPVITSNAASIPEVCGDAALYFDIQAPGQLAEKVLRLFADDDLRLELIEKGKQRSRLFTYNNSALSLLQVIDTVLEL
jgi:glycosyltransferase involved in cell wall biosynthesis